MSVSFPVVVDDDAQAARARMDALMAANGTDSMGPLPHLAGSPAQVAAAIQPYRDLGFDTVIVRMPAPYDQQTIERIGEVAALLDQ
jgi:alkanesulfonate monooxygenase SsuD/methylene tetrahydromethanopterin reductase-like flavin-dependent oxidoreductase (luciferase family)